MKKNFWLYLLLIFSSIINTHAQKTLHDFGFTRNLNIPVADSLTNAYKNAWIGGMNSCQFSQIDLNMDSIKDLFVFDRIGNRVMTFVNNGTADSADHTYAPQYIKCFPKLYEWVQLIDYDGDGKEDIFTYSVGLGSIKVYKNVSDLSDSIKFTLISVSLLSLQQGATLTNILVSPVDYPGIADIDNDGDLDMFSFWGLGSYLQYHRNTSRELYGNSDSLTFILEENCWGNFSESSEGNAITLNIVCPMKSGNIKNQLVGYLQSKDAKHTGSTLLITDLDNDSVKELILGDVTFPNLVALYNGGTPDSANMTSIDTMFPSYDQPVQLVSFPVASYLDVNNDGKKDLVMSPFDPSYTTSENFNSVWLYKNNGTDTVPLFQLEKKNFLQDEMIDVGAGAYPVLYDYDGDGLLDVFVSNFGYYDSSYYSYGNLYGIFTSRIALFQNIGTASVPQFKLITRDFANLGAKHLNAIIPAFGDLDGDGDADMIIGDSKGNLYRYENTAGQGNPMTMLYNDSLIINVGTFSAPQLVDLDRDSLLDLVVGEKKGNLNFYKNTGTKFNPDFTYVTDSLGHINIIDHAVSNYGFSVPCFFEDSIGKYSLFVGSESGKISYYKNIDDSLSGHFTLFDSKLVDIYEGARCGVAVGNLNNDTYPDMIVGNLSGGLSYFEGSAPQPISGIDEHATVSPFNITLFPNPAENNITIDLSEVASGNLAVVYIYDLLGSMVFSKELKNNNLLVVDVKNFSNGIYICNVSSMANDQRSWYSVSKKFIVQH